MHRLNETNEHVSEYDKDMRLNEMRTTFAEKWTNAETFSFQAQ